MFSEDNLPSIRPQVLKVTPSVVGSLQGAYHLLIVPGTTDDCTEMQLRMGFRHHLRDRLAMTEDKQPHQWIKFEGIRGTYCERCSFGLKDAHKPCGMWHPCVYCDNCGAEDNFDKPCGSSLFICDVKVTESSWKQNEPSLWPNNLFVDNYDSLQGPDFE